MDGQTHVGHRDSTTHSWVGFHCTSCSGPPSAEATKAVWRCWTGGIAWYVWVSFNLKNFAMYPEGSKLSCLMLDVWDTTRKSVTWPDQFRAWGHFGFTISSLFAICSEEVKACTAIVALSCAIFLAIQEDSVRERWTFRFGLSLQLSNFSSPPNSPLPPWMLSQGPPCQWRSRTSSPQVSCEAPSRSNISKITHRNLI